MIKKILKKCLRIKSGTMICNPAQNTKTTKLTLIIRIIIQISKMIFLFLLDM